MSINPLSCMKAYLPSIRLATRQEVADRLKTIALPAIALTTAAMAVESHAVKFNECIDNCDRHRDAHELAKLFCYALCALFSER